MTHRQNTARSHHKWLSLFLATSLLGTTCGGPAQQGGIVDSFPRGPVVLEVWRPFSEEGAYRAAAENYLSQHDNVSIIYRFIEPDRYEEELIDALANGTGPDLASLPSDRIPAFADKLVEMPTNFFRGSDLTAYLTARYAPAVSGDATIDGKVYGIPFSTDSLALYWNRGLTKELNQEFLRSRREYDSGLLLRAPVDWDQVVEVTKLITQRTGNTIERSGIALGVSANIPYTADIIAMMMLQRGVTMVSPDHQSAIFHTADPDNPSRYAGAETLDYLKGFVDPNSSYYTWNADMPNAVDAFVEGKVAMMIHDRSIAAYIQQRNPSLNFKVAPLPQLPNAETIVDYAVYPLEVVTNNAKYPAVAWDFLSQVTRSTLPIFATEANRTQPTRRREPTTTVSERAGITNGVFELQVPTAQGWFKGNQAAKVDTLFEQALDRASLAGQSSKDSLNEAARTITAILSSP